MIKKILWGILIFLALLVVVWILGPRVQYDAVDLTRPARLDLAIEEIDGYLQAKEASIEYLKEDNEARVVWADSSHQKTPYSVVYLHGFSASQGEGDPIHRLIADSIGANLFLARLRDHGLGTKEAFRDVSPQDWIDDTKEALAIGRLIGEQVIVVSCSTGGTLSLPLAPVEESLHSLILLSPNIEIADPNAAMITGPWGEQLIESMVGEYRMVDSSQLSQYWSGNYHIDGLKALQWLIDQTMNDDTFKKITTPIYMGYYYKNEQEQDPVVSVDAMLDFYDAVNTPSDQKHKTAFANAGDHVVSSKYKNENWQDVYDDIMAFLVPRL